MEQALDQRYYEELGRAHLHPVWQREVQPMPWGKAMIWRKAEFAQLLERAYRFEPEAEQAQRRALCFRHPDVPMPSVAPNLYGAAQACLPGERVRCHRHTFNQINFALSEGVYNIIEGERIDLEPGDLVAIPSWLWHAHGNDGAEPAMWLTGSDSTLSRKINTFFLEPDTTGAQWAIKPSRPLGLAGGNGLVRPSRQRAAADVPYVHYRWSSVYRELRRQAEEGHQDPWDGVMVEYVNPLTGGAVLPTVGCHLQLLPPRAATREHRHTCNAVYCVYSGSGYSVVEGQRLDWSAGDVFVIPAWSWHKHGNESDDEAIVFSYTDRPMQESLGLYRCEEK